MVCWSPVDVIYKTVCLLLWGRGAVSVKRSWKYQNILSNNILGKNIVGHNILARNILNKNILRAGISSARTWLFSTCGHPKPVLLRLEKLSVQRDLHVKCRLGLKFARLPKISCQQWWSFQKCQIILYVAPWSIKWVNWEVKKKRVPFTHFTCISVW